MVPPDATRIVDGYLVRIAVAARDLPAEQIEELLTEIREHIHAALASSGSTDVTAVQEVIKRLGTPEEIAAAAGAAVPAAPAVASPTHGAAALGAQEIAAVLLLLFGGFLFGVGWIVGVVLLWTSERWITGEKLLGTLVWPFGFAGAFIPWPWAIWTGEAIAPFAFVILAAPVGTAFVLLRAARRRSQPRPDGIAALARRGPA